MATGMTFSVLLRLMALHVGEYTVHVVVKGSLQSLDWTHWTGVSGLDWINSRDDPYRLRMRNGTLRILHQEA